MNIWSLLSQSAVINIIFFFIANTSSIDKVDPLKIPPLGKMNPLLYSTLHADHKLGLYIKWHRNESISKNMVTKNDLVSQLINDDRICRAAPSFAWAQGQFVTFTCQNTTVKTLF